jgi:membrane fusion protein, heavy metal efflux system
MRLGMFVTATFRGLTKEMHTIVPASAIMHMHDRDFVLFPRPATSFAAWKSSVETLQDNTSLQEVKSGLKPGQIKWLRTRWSWTTCSRSNRRP